MTGHRDFSSGPKIRWDQSPYSGHLFTARPNQIDSLLQESAWTRGPPVDPWPFSHIHVYPGTILERCTRMGYSIVSIQVTENSFETDCCSKETVKQFLIQSCTWKTNEQTRKPKVVLGKELGREGLDQRRLRCQTIVLAPQPP